MNNRKRTNGTTKFADLPDWVRPMDAFRYLNISRSVLYELVKVGTIPSKRLGRSIRIPKHALDPYTHEPAA